MRSGFLAKKRGWIWAAVAFVLLAVVGVPVHTRAAEAGATIDNPIDIVFGKEYEKSWTRDTQNSLYYHKMVLDQQGIVAMDFTKPYRNDGSYGWLIIKIYDSNQKLIWYTDCRGSRGTISSKYSFGAGLAKGEYYVLVGLDTYLYSGDIASTKYKFSFAPTEYCEIEPNNDETTATLIKADGVPYQGYFGEGEVRERYSIYDYFKFDLAAGKKYRIRIDNYLEFDKVVSDVGLYSPKRSLSWLKFNGVGDNYRYCEFIAAETGMYDLFFSRSVGTLAIFERQTPYKLTVGIAPCAQHTFGEGVVTKQPTFSETGIMTYTCTVCGLAAVQQIDQLPSMGWLKAGDKSYWYEGGVKQGTYADAKGVLGDGTVRGREIYDSSSNGWYWLDACYDGAKACGKEVWMPYIYQQEKGWKDNEIAANALASGSMAAQVEKAIREGTGKWVRYDANGKMYKGWYTVSGSDAALYPAQVGNTYYYDPMTGLMAKGYVTINGILYHFNETTGARD